MVAALIARCEYLLYAYGNDAVLALNEHDVRAARLDKLQSGPWHTWDMGSVVLRLAEIPAAAALKHLRGSAA